MKSKTPKSNASVRAQIHKTRNRVATARKKSVATRERGGPEQVRDEVDDRRMAIPTNTSTSILVSLGLPVVIEPLEIFL
jgi:thiamine biosynthesis protein ThiC